MIDLPESAFGHTDRHYASTAREVHTATHSDEMVSSRWAATLQQASPGIRDSVERAYKQWNATLRDYLRTETALRLTVGKDSRSVPVKVVDGMPPRFAEVMHEFEGLEWLLLNRPAVDAAASGTRFMEHHVKFARAAWGDAAGPSDVNEIQHVHVTAVAWLTKLDELHTVERIVGINEDVLGAYFFRIPEIRLYWVVIGITALALGVSAEALTIVVLAHELAHAYTHLGSDIDHERWDTQHFAMADLDIVEGLAQFYTQVICEKLGERMPAALETYQALLEKQSGPYRAHLEWVGDDERSGEIIRISMIECRSKGITTSSDFSSTVKRYRTRIRSGKQGLFDV